MIRLSSGLQDSIRFETNYAHLSRSLLHINARRFRALGDNRCRQFVSLGLELGDTLDLTRIGSVAYLLYLMQWLGSSFHTDPRYATIHEPLRSRGAETDRVDAARDAFMAFADKHIGENAEILTARLARLDELEQLVFDQKISHSALHDQLLAMWKIDEAEEGYERAFIEAKTVEMSKDLNADTETGRRTCLLLSFILGVRADRDPLFPWISDAAKAAQDTNEAVDRALFSYAKKRLEATLRSSNKDKDEARNV